MSSPLEFSQHHFFRLASQYYVAGRFAALTRLMPVSANLLHHAIEMYLKGALATKLTLSELKKPSHHLTKVWEMFKSHFNDPALAVFDSAVAELDKFEAVRYPDSIITDGMAVQLALFHGDLVPSVQNSSMSATYQLVLEDVDALVKVIFEKARVNPDFYFSELSGDSLRYLSDKNCHIQA